MAPIGVIVHDLPMARNSSACPRGIAPLIQKQRALVCGSKEPLTIFCAPRKTPSHDQKLALCKAVGNGGSSH